MSKPYYSVETLEPNRSIGYLIKRCGVLMTQVAERRFEALDMSFTQWTALACVSTQGCVTASQLSTHLGHDMGALTRVVDELERRGLLRRERSREDRRSVQIAITPAGRRQAESGKRTVVELLNELVAPCTEQEIETLIALLQRLYAHLQSAVGLPSESVPAAARSASSPRRKKKSGARP
jgi:DNA-binding MarR family transcriptional regulator